MEMHAPFNKDAILIKILLSAERINRIGL